MLIGVPCEIKTQEYRVGLTPSSVREIVHHGHAVIVQTEAGLGANFTDDDYRAVGATVAPDAATVFAAAATSLTGPGVAGVMGLSVTTGERLVRASIWRV